MSFTSLVAGNLGIYLMTSFYQLNQRIIILAALLTMLIFTSLVVVKPALGQTPPEAAYTVNLATLGYPTKTLIGPNDNTRYLFTLPAS